MTANTTTSTRRVAAGAVAQHDCAERGCLAAMLGLGDATASDAEEGSSSSGCQAAADRGQQDRHTQVYVGQHDGGVDRLRTVRKDRRDRSWRSQRVQLRISQFCGADQVDCGLARRMLSSD